MKRIGLIVTAAMALVACGTTSRLYAQMMPFNPPASPYLNLLRPGQSAGINWMNLVQPEMELFGAVNQLQMGVNQAQATAVAGADPSLGSTGHPAMFGPNYLQYYPMARGGMGGGGMGMGGMGGGMGGGGMGMGGMGGMGMGGMGGMGMGGMGGMGMGGMGGMGMGGMGGMGMGGMGGMGMPR